MLILCCNASLAVVEFLIVISIVIAIAFVSVIMIVAASVMIASPHHCMCGVERVCRMHAVWDGIKYTDPQNSSLVYSIKSLDAALVVPGPQLPGIGFGLEPMPNIAEYGMSFCLLNNAW